MKLYFIVCPQSFYTHPPTESLIQGFGDTSPIVHQLFFSPLQLVQQKLLLQLSYPKYPLPIEFFLVLIIQDCQLLLFSSLSPPFIFSIYKITTILLYCQDFQDKSVVTKWFFFNLTPE